MSLHRPGGCMRLGARMHPDSGEIRSQAGFHVMPDGLGQRIPRSAQHPLHCGRLGRIRAGRHSGDRLIARSALQYVQPLGT
ncbi:hypothetical protein [Streptomyces yunnanensis]|uniref:hypothetical protein n=1 Tax=Streptomyces yunnanensis TaxID=156453 RepID=UPI00256FDEA0|nr:hypothetical protein [Streptomyces yunnanensis]